MKGVLGDVGHFADILLPDVNTQLPARVLIEKWQPNCPMTDTKQIKCSH